MATKPKTITLRPHELARLDSAGSVCVVRVMRKQPDWNFPGLVAKGVGDDEGWWKLSPGDAPIPCPFGRVGDVVGVREAWASPSKYIVAYRADAECGAWMGDGDGGRMWVPHGVITESPAYQSRFANGQRHRSLGLGRYGGRWRSPATMPAWAIRTHLTLASVDARRVQTVTEAEAREAGIGSPITRDCKLPRFIQQHDAHTRNPAHKYDANPHVWIGTFTRSER